MVKGLRIRWIRHDLRAVVFMGMVPLIILNGWPVGGCICADGQYRASCSGCRSRARDATTPQNSIRHASDERACCTARKVSNVPRSCCKGNHCCEQSKGRTSHGTGVRNPCCTPVVQMQAAPAVSVSPAIEDHDRGLAVFAALANPPSLAVAALHGRGVEIDIELPSNDLVVILQRLII